MYVVFFRFFVEMVIFVSLFVFFFLSRHVYTHFYEAILNFYFVSHPRFLAKPYGRQSLSVNFKSS